MVSKKFNLSLNRKINDFNKIIDVDSDKSISIRSFLIGAISQNVSSVENVLESQELRDGIKEYSDWPTIPQLYIKGEFIGGCDIVKEMFESGELKSLLENKKLI